MVKLKLTQTGTKNRKTYRFVAIDERERRDGKPIEVLGYYDPLVKPPKISVKKERVQYWISVGAQPTESVKKILQLS
jgi:small subunit ribosomal protein S16